MRSSPKGSIFQHWPTAYPRRIMIGTGQMDITGADDTQSVRVCNRDPTGSFIVVWDCSIDCEPKATWDTNQFGAFFAYGPDNGLDAPAPAFPIGLSFPQGQGVVQNVLNDALTDRYPYQPLNHPGQWQWNHDYPIAYLQPGQYFGIAVDANIASSFGSVVVNFMWEWGVPRV